MDIQKNIINFYEMSIRLEHLKLRNKHLRNQLQASSTEPVLDFLALQKRVDYYVEIEKASEKIVVLPSQLLAIHSRVITVLKEVEFPEGQKILITREDDSALNFWYDGSELFIEEAE